MKLLLFSLSFLLIIVSCKKDPEESCADGILNQDEVSIDCGGACNPCPVSYPETGNYGLNLLAGTDSLFLSVGYYSFTATIPKGSSLKIVFISNYGDHWYLGPNEEENWTATYFNPATDSQTFTTTSSGIYDLQIYFSSMSNGVATLNYYENGSNALSRQKVIVWEE